MDTPILQVHVVGSPFLIAIGVFFSVLAKFLGGFFSHVGEHHLGEGIRGAVFFF